METQTRSAPELRLVCRDCGLEAELLDSGRCDSCDTQSRYDLDAERVALAIDAERRVEEATTQDEREYWQRTAAYWLEAGQ